MILGIGSKKVYKALKISIWTLNNLTRVKLGREWIKYKLNVKYHTYMYIYIAFLIEFSLRLRWFIRWLDQNRSFWNVFKCIHFSYTWFGEPTWDVWFWDKGTTGLILVKSSGIDWPRWNVSCRWSRRLSRPGPLKK
jgi:hypothetical protein